MPDPDRPARPSTSPDPLGGGIIGRRPAAVLLGLVALVWGVHWAVIRVGLGVMSPFAYGTLRAAGGFATLAVLLAMRRALRLPARADLPIILSIGVGQMAGTIVIANLALQVVPAGRSSVLMYTMPLWVAAIQTLVLRVPIRRGEVVALGLGLAGVIALLNPIAIDWTSSGQLLGSVGLLVAGVIWAVTTIHVRRHRWIGTPLSLQPWQVLSAFLTLAVMTLLLEPAPQVRWEPLTIGVLLYSGPLATAFAYWASQTVTRAIGPLATSTALLAVPLVGLLSGALLLGERITLIDLAGFALVLSGVGILARAGETRDVTVPDATA